MVAAGGASAATEITGCQEITEPGDYYLSSDIIDTTTADVCIYITADDVTLDGQGHCIDGSTPGTCKPIEEDGDAVYPSLVNGYARAGIIVKKADNVIVKNVEVKNFCNGILLYGASDSNTVENCIVHDNGNPTANVVDDGDFNGISVFNRVCNSIIRDNTVYDNTGEIYGDCDDSGAGISVKKFSNYNHVTNNTVFGNTFAGIYGKKGGGDCFNTIDYNRVYENGQTGDKSCFTGGIRLQCKSTDDYTIEYNTVWDNIGPGIFVGGNDCEVKGNTVTGSKNAYSGNPGYGLYVDRYSDSGGRRAKVYDNTFCDNEGFDINIQNADAGTTGDDNTCDTTSNYDDAGTTGCTNPCTAPEEPDLTITEKSETLDGSTFTVTYTVKNNGGGNAGASTTSISVDGTQVATDSVGALAAGATHDGTVVIDSFDCPCGTDVTVKVCADNDGVVDESDETNNCLENTFNCPPCSEKPDLVITEKSEDWVDQVNKTYNITYTVANNGDAAAGASTTSIKIDGVEAATDTVPALSISESRTATLGPFTMSGDDDTINVCADSENEVDEGDETNNCLENTFAVEGKQSYGGSVYYKKNAICVWNTLGEPDELGAVLYRNAKIAIELEETVSACKNVSVWVTQLGFYPVYFEVAVSVDGSNWDIIGSETCNTMWVWTQYDFDGEFGDVRYIKITKPGSRRPPKFMGLDAVYAKN